jgi:hypothetical protein
MQLGETVPTSAAVPFAVMVTVAPAPINRIKPVFRVLFTVTANAGTLADEKVTPGTVVGKLNVTVSEAVPPNPLSRA